jgi:hypothetical protein
MWRIGKHLSLHCHRKSSWASVRVSTPRAFSLNSIPHTTILSIQLSSLNASILGNIGTIAPVLAEYMRSLSSSYEVDCDRLISAIYALKHA